VRKIEIHFRKQQRRDWVLILSPGGGMVDDRLDRPNHLNAFAYQDGFFDWRGFRDFWRAHHHGVEDFHGLLIEWEPL
jgi:hypothetical protein